MKSILVIEDDSTVREGIIDLLREENFNVTGAENGLLGLERAKELVPDLIISDILMPELDGYGVLNGLQKDPLTSSIPFIFLSAMTGEADIRAGMKIGADDYLTKPYKAQDLLDAVNARLIKVQQYDSKFEELNNVIIRSLPHELRTPLVTILGYSQLLADNPSEYSEPEVKSLAESIKLSGYDLLEIIQKFLNHNELHAAYVDKTRLTAVKNTYTHKADAFIKHYAEAISERFNRQDDLKLDVAECSLRISDHYLKILIEEILGNAFKFSAFGSQVTLRSEIENDYCILSITDNGIGMSKGQVRNIGLLKQFDREKNFQCGLGIGLSLVKKIVSLHEGNLSINSETGKYTTVKIILPLVNDQNIVQ